MKIIDNDYKLIPMNEITEEAREIAKRWYDGVSNLNDIREKHKLASDIMNYARRYHKQQTSIQAERELLSCPGDTILETIEFKEWTRSTFAEKMGVTGQQARLLIQGKEILTDEIAARLEEVLGINKSFWINREKLYREKLAWIEITEAALNEPAVSPSKEDKIDIYEIWHQEKKIGLFFYKEFADKINKFLNNE